MPYPNAVKRDSTNEEISHINLVTLTGMPETRNYKMEKYWDFSGRMQTQRQYANVHTRFKLA